MKSKNPRKPRSKASRIILNSLFILTLVLVFLGVGFVLWALNPLGPGQGALEALESNDFVQITVLSNNWIIFDPAPSPGEELGSHPKGLIFYPGGRVDYRSYAPALRKIAELGLPVVLVPAPLNLMVLGSGRATQVVERFPQIDSWALGGHSLGAAMAAYLLYSQPELRQSITSLVLWAGYPAESWDLRTSGLRVLSITADQDLVFNRETFGITKDLLPPTTQFLEILGGNHAGFGDYGPQPGDGHGSIGWERQTTEVALITAGFLFTQP